MSNGVPSSLAGSGLPNEWWKKQETVNVRILGQQGFILNRYTVYEILTDVRVFFFVIWVYSLHLHSSERHQFRDGIPSLCIFGVRASRLFF